MGLGDKIGNKAEELKGKGKAAVGEATDDTDKKAEGKADQAGAKSKQVGENLKDAWNNATS